MNEEDSRTPASLGGAAPVAAPPTEVAKGEEGPLLDLRDLRSVILQFETPLLRYTLHLLGSGAPEAEDVVQETFFRLHQQVQESGPESIHNPRAWLYRVAHNLAMEAGRRRGHDKQAGDELLRRSEAEAGRDGDLLEQLVRREAGEMALRELKNLPDDERQILLLKAIQGLKLREISEVTGLGLSTVAFKLNQGLAALARRLKAAGVVG